VDTCNGVSLSIPYRILTLLRRLFVNVNLPFQFPTGFSRFIGWLRGK